MSELTLTELDMANLKISQLPVATSVSNSAVVPVVDSSTTYQMTVDNLFGSSRRQDFSLFSELWNPSIISGLSAPLAIGDNDVYTVPFGKRAIVSGCTISNFSGGTVTAFCEIKHLGTYYRSSSNSSPISNGTVGFISMVAVVLDAGDSIAVNAATTAGAYAIFNICEFSESSLRGIFKFGTTTGDNTLYTCQTGKAAMSVGFVSAGTSSWGSRSPYQIGIGSVAPGNVIASLVKSGGSPSVPLISSSAGVVNTVSNALSILFGLTAGDSIVVNVGTGDPNQMIFGAVLEFNN